MKECSSNLDSQCGAPALLKLSFPCLAIACRFHGQLVRIVAPEKNDKPLFDFPLSTGKSANRVSLPAWLSACHSSICWLLSGPSTARWPISSCVVHAQLHTVSGANRGKIRWESSSSCGFLSESGQPLFTDDHDRWVSSNLHRKEAQGSVWAGDYYPGDSCGYRQSSLLTQNLSYAHISYYNSVPDSDLPAQTLNQNFRLAQQAVTCKSLSLFCSGLLCRMLTTGPSLRHVLHGHR
jgi:hypothetical protein